jgi:SAM-dependent methyltransferase
MLANPLKRLTRARVSDAVAPTQRTDARRSSPESDRRSRLNLEFWAKGDHVGYYATDELRAPESVMLASYGAELSGRVLELGCGAGRVTRHLLELARTLDAIDISPAMIAHCRHELPGASYHVGDLRELSGFADGSFEAVVAPFCVLDVFDDTERRGVLEAIARVLVADGLLIASTHNLAYAPHIAKPGRILARSPRRIASNLLHMPVRVRNSRRLRALERVGADHAVLVDEGHDYSLLHYYISRDGQERQLSAHGFELCACLDLDGRPVHAGEARADCPELHYAARRAGPSRAARRVGAS